MARTCRSRAAAQQVGDQLGARVDQVLAIVEHQQQLLRLAGTRSACRSCCARGCRAGRPPRRPRPAPATRRPARPARPASCRRRSCATWCAHQLLRQARLAHAAGADQRQQRRRRQHVRRARPARARGRRSWSATRGRLCSGSTARRAAASERGRSARLARAAVRRPALRTLRARRRQPSARASSATVSRRGMCAPPRSSSLMLRGLTPARSASSSWVRPAARRWSRSSSPKRRRRVAHRTRSAIVADSRVAPFGFASVASRAASLAWSARHV